jgi:23S rRNA (adenine2503-C2)-methyltransferase
MKIRSLLTVPTGDILVVDGAKGALECLSLADYGQSVNLNQHKPVVHGPLLPLTEKWVCTISTQYGCSMGCSFCDVPRVGPGRNATLYDLTGQILTVLRLHPEIAETARLNIHFARMGEPTWNPAVLDCGKWIHDHLGPEYHPHPVVSTMMPARNDWLRLFIHTWARMKNRLYHGNAGLQLSINSTNEDERAAMFDGSALPLPAIARIMEGIVPVGRKITLNFAVAGWEVRPDVLLRYFDPSLYVVKLTPMHKTTTAVESDLKTCGDYTTPEPYEQIERALIDAGYEVLVFIASREEDESRITCGNAILADVPTGGS